MGQKSESKFGTGWVPSEHDGTAHEIKATDPIQLWNLVVVDCVWKTNDNANYDIEMKVKTLSNMSAEAQITAYNPKTWLSPWKLNSVTATVKGINLISTSYIADCSYYGASTFGTEQIGRKLFARYVSPTEYVDNKLIRIAGEHSVPIKSNCLYQLILINGNWLTEWWIWATRPGIFFPNNVCINNLYLQFWKHINLFWLHCTLICNVLRTEHNETKYWI